MKRLLSFAGWIFVVLVAACRPPIAVPAMNDAGIDVESVDLGSDAEVVPGATATNDGGDASTASTQGYAQHGEPCQIDDDCEPYALLTCQDDGARLLCLTRPGTYDDVYSRSGCVADSECLSGNCAFGDCRDGRSLGDECPDDPDEQCLRGLECRQISWSDGARASSDVVRCLARSGTAADGTICYADSECASSSYCAVFVSAEIPRTLNDHDDNFGGACRQKHTLALGDPCPNPRHTRLMTDDCAAGLQCQISGETGDDYGTCVPVPRR